MTAGGRVTQMLNRVPALPQMLIPKLLSDPIGQVIDMGIGGARTVDHKIGRIGEEMIAGSIHDREYKNDSVVAQQLDLMSYGFVSQLVRAYHARGPARYFDGPTMAGVQSKQIALDGAEHIVKTRRPGEELIIAGWSRGGLIGINVCDLIARHGHEVDLLILLDPVDRASGIGHCDISAAVKNCILIQRDDYAVAWKPYTRQVSIRGGITFPSNANRPTTNSRWYFGRMVDEADHATLTGGSLKSAVFDATHAAFAGVPWTGDKPNHMNERQDRILTEQMAKTLNQAILGFSGGWDPGLRLLTREKKG